MRDFDKLRSGSITKAQFLSCLSMSKINLSRKESELISCKYQHETKPEEVYWRQFCDEIDEVFVIKNLETKSDIKDLTSITKTSFKLNELTLPEEATLQEILRKMKTFFDINRIDPKPDFTNYDDLKRGKVLKPQFKKIVHSMKLMLNDEELEILMKKYGDPISNEINYVVILNDCKAVKSNKMEINSEEQVETETKVFNPTQSSANNYYTYQTHFLNINFNLKDVIDKLKNCVKINRIRLQEFFKDFDQLRKGVVSKAKFRTALDMAK